MTPYNELGVSRRTQARRIGAMVDVAMAVENQTPQTLSESTGIASQRISKIAIGSSSPNFLEALDLSTALSTPVDVFIQATRMKGRLTPREFSILRAAAQGLNEGLSEARG